MRLSRFSRAASSTTVVVATLMPALIAALVLACAPQSARAQAGLIISQIYTGGGSGIAGTTYTQDYIELFNGSGAAINLSTYTLQYASNTGNFPASNPSINLFALSGTIQNNRFFLISTGSAGTAGANVPNPDIANSTINLSNAGGKLALASNSSQVTFTPGANTSFTSNNVVDFIGYGTTDTFEGTSAAPQPTDTTMSLIRRTNAAGTAFRDTNNNGADFVLTAANSPGPRNSNSISPFADTPEPGTLPLVGMGLVTGLGMVKVARRKRQAQKSK